MTASFATSKWFVGAMVIGLLASITSAVEFAGGTGEPGDPYQIATAEQLISIGSDPNLLDKCFILVNDIDLDPNLPGGRVFDGPVITMVPGQTGATDPNFTGSLDGRGFRVRHLVIRARAGSTAALGLFGRIGREACVRNLAVENAWVLGEMSNAAAGTLVGINWGLVEACYATGSITGGDMVGGLCGENVGKIRSCYAAVSVSGQQSIGGLIGYGGGRTSGAARGVIVGVGHTIDCYVSGAVSGRENVGGLIGAGGVAQACFWDLDTTGQKTSVAGGGLPTFQMMDAVVFASAGWDEDSNWIIDDGRDYPRLVWEGTPGQRIRGGISDRLEGSGTPQDPYHIATVEQFALLGLLSDLSDKHFALDTDLDLTGIPLRPISYFNGFFHGNRHVLRHLTMEAGGISRYLIASPGALFGSIGASGRVSCLGLEDVAIAVNTEAYIIGVLAAVNEGVVTGCYATGTVCAGQIQSAISLVGDNRGMLARSYMHIDIDGPNSIGELVGVNYSSPTSASRRLPAGATYSGIILECYAALGMPEGNANGGLTGTNNGLVLSSYFLTGPKETSPDGVGDGSVPLADSQMRQQDSFVGWDFAGSSADGTVDRWHMPDANYPVLAWQVDWEGLRPIPDIADLPLDWARTELELAGFVVGDILYDYHSAIPKERAILTSPVGLAPVGSTVDIIASQGTETWLNSRSLGYDAPAALLVEFETPGQVECHAGGIGGGAIVLLTRDIDMVGWDILPAPGTSSAASFHGAFLGQDHKISHLKTYRDEALFGQIAADGFVYELRLEDVWMLGSGDTSVGGLAAENDGVVMRCAVTGTLHGSENTLNLGGLVGTNTGIIEYCSVDAAVHGSPREQADPQAAPRNVGGVVGCNKGDLIDSYARGEVSGLARIGGLLGANEGSVAGSYAAVHITTSEQENVGGLIGYNGFSRSRGGQGAPLPVTGCYWLGVADSEGLDNGHGIPLSDAQMKQKASFAGWDFESTWMICEGVDYPRLQWEGAECDDGF
ncbi:MAG: PASTA domain-containing protein [Phycisphaerae bacterium]|nr:PASTA domain-containing protein [Phycisphaerae bacterium]